MSPDRRVFLLAGLSFASVVAHGQPATRQVATFGPGRGAPLAARFASLGWKEGQNLRVDSRIVDQYASRAGLDLAARDLVAGRPDVIVAMLSERVGALVRATRSIPIVAGLHDPVLDGFAQSLVRPGGNVTGLALASPESVKLMFRLLGAVLPDLKRVHTLEPPGFHLRATVREVRDAVAAEKGFAFHPHPVETYADATRALATVRNPREEAVVLTVDGRDFDYADFAARVLRARIPTIDMYGNMQAGSLLRAGLRHEDLWGRMAAIVDKVLRGANPATIPFEQPTHADVELDRRTANAIGVTFPPEVMMRATKVIE
jgi:putative ABC transport system substrate-binding protein